MEALALEKRYIYKGWERNYLTRSIMTLATLLVQASFILW